MSSEGVFAPLQCSSGITQRKIGMRQALEIFRNHDEKVREREAFQHIVIVCQQAHKFHKLAVDVVVDRSIRSVLETLANAHEQVLEILGSISRPKLKFDTVENNSAEIFNLPKFKALRALRELEGQSLRVLVPTIVLEIESTIIKELRKSLKDVRTRMLRERLSSQIALMQMSLDQIVLLNEYRS